MGFQEKIFYTIIVICLMEKANFLGGESREVAWMTGDNLISRTPLWQNDRFYIRIPAIIIRYCYFLIAKPMAQGLVLLIYSLQLHALGPVIISLTFGILSTAMMISPLISPLISRYCRYLIACLVPIFTYGVPPMITVSLLVILSSGLAISDFMSRYTWEFGPNVWLFFHLSSSLTVSRQKQQKKIYDKLTWIPGSRLLLARR